MNSPDLPPRKRRPKGFSVLVYTATIAGPLTAIPQILKTYSLKSAHELSLVMWVAGLGLAAIWFIHGIRIHDRPIIIMNFLWLILNSIIITQILMYS